MSAARGASPVRRGLTLGEAQVVGFGDRHAEEDRIDLRDRGEQRALPAADEIARLHLRGADQSVDRRRDARVAQVERRLLHRRLRGFDFRSGRVSRGQRVVELLLADGLFRHERRVTRDVVPGLLEPGLGGGLVGLGPGQDGLERLAVDLVQQVALPNERTLAEVHRLEEAFDAGPDFHVLESLWSDRPDPGRPARPAGRRRPRTLRSAAAPTAPASRTPSLSAAAIATATSINRRSA